MHPTPPVERGIAAPRTEFRDDINGLRAWAVCAVILFHFGIPGFDGGFVGVDIFFVISGFLMTGIIARGLEQGNFSITGFYLARAKRIIPALAVLCLALLVLGWFALMPLDYKSLSSHAVYAISFLSNIEFWREAGYFDQRSHEKWLLHTWSLSVEWQFYLILPVLMACAWRVSPGLAWQRWILAACTLASLLACVIATRIDQALAFYLLPTRAWEMLAGGLVFLLARRRVLEPAGAAWIECAGFALISVSIACFDRTTAWPGWQAIVPVGATMAILAVQRNSPWTGNPLAQWLGTRSYSLYLWHWPVCVVLYYLEQADDPAAIAAGLLATFILGHVSYRWFENWPRIVLGNSGRLRASGIIVLAGCCVAFPATAVWYKGGFAERVPHELVLIANEANNFNPRRSECHTSGAATPASCVYGGADTRVLVVGDSHADALVSAIAAAAPDKRAGAIQWTYSGCVFVPGLKLTPAAIASDYANSRCPGFVEWVEAQLRETQADIPVVIINRYAAAAFGLNENHASASTPRVYFSRVALSTTPEFLDEFSRVISDTTCELAKERPVYLVRPIPEMGVNVPKALSRRLAMGVHEEVSISLDAYRARNAWVWAAQDKAREQCGVRILDPLPYLCDRDRCYGSRNGRPLYADDDHLSEDGNKVLIPMFAELFGNR